MLNIIRSAFACLFMLWLPALQAADSGWLQEPANDHAKVRLRADTSQPGETRLLLAVELQKGWKTYWRSPGEGGIAPAIAWQGNPPAAVWHWPTPQRFEVAGITTQGYHDSVSLPIVLPGRLSGSLAGTLTLSTCSNVCILTDYPFSLDLAAPNDPQFNHDFAQAMGQVPIASGLAEGVKAGYRHGELQIVAERAAGWRHPALFFDTLNDADLGKPRVEADGERLLARVPVSDGWGDAAPDLRGKTLTLVLSDGGMAQQVTLPIGEPLAPPGAGTFPLWQAVLMALAGGLILNLMPCVLPVLGIKLGSVLQVERRDRRSVRLQFLASSLGILASFMALALLMTLLRLGNHALGWGIQFQNPWFIGFMVVVTLLFSANLFGLFHLRLSSSLNTSLATHDGHGLSGHFWQGAFATLLATPCSAPFLGTAVAFALAAPLPVLWGMFVALGIGMSLPWLLIAAWPALALRLPRPGRWMNGLKLAMGLLMLASSLWLLSLMTNHIGVRPTLWLGGLALLGLLLAAWRRHGARLAGKLAAGLLVVAGIGLLAGALTAGQWRQPLQDKVHWQPLSERAIEQALARHQRVFVDVTADWCVTCKANKFNVLLRDDVQRALSADDVVALRGDWSRPSADISAFLQRRGSVAVPFNQIYGPGRPDGEVLSPLLTREAVLQTLSEAKGTEQ
ncbi:protein-disulfide reductase DsbD family protein [Serratia ficaria]|uniref:protein-disulfide reductase DsbD family protein n=1 Tax=Serratia ficaria TaxID=61651 RepID=UPI00217C1798|nr:protein-disulfide reductase DsbD domain-containing protein [Serratia ficaria]CAI0837667.1 Thiol:disulfide interchange protein DsbD precursor [Serratia ficaria]CAI1081081.1 Thiol:disulfide interchange protein DsbD precursor [Serratia ficaria]CAI1657610.1 Thiol:disulfide interchange protein DsbD precursor [Serratia ficaria]CAI2467076.1 Thiol:disulfide interchange protein DsbD precursor [Serratia ficaria]CAI2480402.1 Thiol:disulfide interchange protein DsbD precursor [Serratia ficaria]